MGQEPLRPERRRAQEVERQADTFDRSQQFLDAAARDAFSPANRLRSGGQAIPNRIEASRPRALGATLDFANEVGPQPHRDPLRVGGGPSPMIE